MTSEQLAADDQRSADVNASLRAAVEAGTDPFVPEMQELVAEHYAWVAEQWAGRQPTQDAYVGLSQMYAADERFAAYYGGKHNAQTIGTAIEHWARLHL